MPEPITYFDRYSKSIRQEKIYGDAALRWVYETTPGKLALATVVKRAWFSRWYGWKMSRPKTRDRIAPFIDEYELDSNEFLRPIDEFEHFNAFFSRELTKESRPIDSSPDRVVFPADGRHLCIPDLSRSQGLFVKGEQFDTAKLIGDEKLAARFADGSLLLSRLCPVDYHRFHFPASGTPTATRSINGPLYSVNPIALKQNIQILATNKRTITTLQTDRVGDVLLIEVGATCVGSIRQTYESGIPVQKGEEKGYFRFGGSSTITIFRQGVIQFDGDLVQQSSNHIELYAKMGDSMATVL
ncbi:MAG: phosphatidylserine decarboxylase [Planctomycetota bacterium]